MIKINGLNYKEGDGGYYLFGHFNGNGYGKGINSWYFPNPFRSRIGNRYCFGYCNGNGESYKLLKEKYQK